MPLSIVPARLEHLHDCQECLVHSEIGEKYFSSDEAMETFLKRGIERGEVHVALDESSQCLGYAWIVFNGAFCRYPYLLNIAVAKCQRGKGIGSKLLTFFEQRGFEHASRIFLLVSDFNLRARELYTRLGYEEVGLIPDLVIEGVSEHIMMKRGES